MSSRNEAGSPNRREEGTPRRMPRFSERGGSHLYIQGNSKEEIADILQVDPAIFDGLDKWGKLEW